MYEEKKTLFHLISGCLLSFLTCNFKLTIQSALQSCFSSFLVIYETTNIRFTSHIQTCTITCACNAYFKHLTSPWTAFLKHILHHVTQPVLVGSSALWTVLWFVETVIGFMNCNRGLIIFITKQCLCSDNNLYIQFFFTFAARLTSLLTCRKL